MENPEELLHSLEEFAKARPRSIPRELEEYLCFVAKTGDPVYQWPAIRTLFRQKLINVITEFYESCASMEIPACPNVEIFNYEVMKNFILEKFDTFVSAPFTVQRICELLTSPRKEYNRIDKYMRALEKNILVVSTIEPGRVGAKNGESFNGIDSDHTPETSHCNDINVDEMDDNPSWRNGSATAETAESTSFTQTAETTENQTRDEQMDTENKKAEVSKPEEETPDCKTAVDEDFVSIQLVAKANSPEQTIETETTSSVTITAVPAGLQNRRSSVEPDVSSETTDEPSPVPEDQQQPAEAEPLVVEKDQLETNEAEKSEDPKDEGRLILTTSDSGIENISPESSTSSPETLQNEETSEATAEPSQSNKDAAKIEEEVEVDSSDAVESQEPKESEVSSSVVETSSEADATPALPQDDVATEDIPMAVEADPVPEESTAEPHPEPDSEKPDTAMDVDSSSDKPEGSEAESPQ